LMSSPGLAEEHLNDTVSPDSAFTPPSFPLSPPVSPEHPTTIPPLFPLHDPAAYSATSPSLFGHSVFSEYPTITPSSFSLPSVNHSTSPEYPAIAPTSFPLHYPVSPAYPAIPPSIPCRPASGSSISQPWQDRVTINMLPEDALLEIFDWYLKGTRFIFYKIEIWQVLGHVCRKWRNLVFGSPHRLNLQLFCTSNKPVKKMLDIWPPLPIIVLGERTTTDEDNNIIAALEQNDRVCQIRLKYLQNSLWEKVFTVMREPFPVLTSMELHSSGEEPPTVSDSFLGRSAPHLQFLQLCGVPFPGLHKLLPSATHLVTLHIWDVSRSGYIPPEAMVTALSALTMLKEFKLQFRSHRSFPDRERRHPPPLTRSVLPALIHFTFRGVTEYLEDLVARIDAPLLDRLEITFFRQLIFHTPQFAQFIGRTPNLMAYDEAHVVFTNYTAELQLARRRGLRLEIHCNQSEWQLSMLAQVCTSSLPLIFSLEHLYIHEYGLILTRPLWEDDIEDVQWLELLHPFTTVKALYLSRDITSRIAPALEELAGERATEVLPTLQSLFLEELEPSEPVQKAIDKFVGTRQLSNHPIVISHWNGKPAPWWMAND